MDHNLVGHTLDVQEESMVCEPPWTGWIETTGDALLILEAARRGMIPRVTRRLVDSERKMITSGSVFVFDEDESGIKRWTDGFFWSPSRILGNFLLYRETDKKSNLRGQRANSSSLLANEGPSSSLPSSNHRADSATLSRPKNIEITSEMDRARERSLFGSLTNSKKFKSQGMMKKTFSLTIGGVAQHLISYYKVEDVEQGRLRTPSSLPELASLEISPEYLDKTHFRVPPRVEYDSDGVPRYRGEADEPDSPGVGPSDLPASPASPTFPKKRGQRRFEPYNAPETAPSSGKRRRSHNSPPDRSNFDDSSTSHSTTGPGTTGVIAYEGGAGSYFPHSTYIPTAGVGGVGVGVNVGVGVYPLSPTGYYPLSPTASHAGASNSAATGQTSLGYTGYTSSSPEHHTHDSNDSPGNSPTTTHLPASYHNHDSTNTGHASKSNDLHHTPHVHAHAAFYTAASVTGGIGVGGIYAHSSTGTVPGGGQAGVNNVTNTSGGAAAGVNAGSLPSMGVSTVGVMYHYPHALMWRPANAESGVGAIGKDQMTGITSGMGLNHEEEERKSVDAESQASNGSGHGTLDHNGGGTVAVRRTSMSSSSFE